MIKFICTFALFFSVISTSNATVWIVMANPSENKIGAIGMSSGPIGRDTLVYEDNIGIISIGAFSLRRAHKKLSPLLYRAVSTSRMIQEMSLKASDRKGKYQRRVTLVRSNFEVATVAGGGCHTENNFCGETKGKYFAITGGGLTGPENLTETAKFIEFNQTTNMPIECQLEAAMQKLAIIGGEWKLFERLVFLVDDIQIRGDSKVEIFKRNGRWEGDLNQDLRDYLLEKKNIKCQSLYD